MKLSLYYQSLDGKKVQCHLCPHNCVIQPDKAGICRQRKNIDGVLYSLNYGQVVSANLDPMEKKPLYHFYPGEKILSIGTNGCNLSCQFCQNWSISQQDSPAEEITPEDVVRMAKSYKARFIAYTYNEPFIWYEFVLATAKVAKEQGIMNVLVTNGFVNPKPLEELLPYISAMNIDIKSIKGDYYLKLCKARLEPVLATAKMAKNPPRSPFAKGGDKGVHLEITNLVIPGENDAPEQFEELSKWIAENLGRDTPLHFSAYFPSYKMDNPPTPPETLSQAHKIARKYLNFVYLGNISGGEVGRDTFCHNCGIKLIERIGYQTKIISLGADGLCSKCKSPNNIKS